MSTALSGTTIFDSFKLRSLTLNNRVAVSPMCEYSSVDGCATDWHLVHLGARAQGGAGLIIVEATAVVPEGRISPADMGLWKEEQIPGLKRIVEFVHSQGSAIAVQLAHAGRKASMTPPWDGEKWVSPENGGWKPVAPSAVEYSAEYGQPAALDKAGIRAVIDAFVAATKRAESAGFDGVEIHAAHGYLLHQFLSPITNKRTDEYGGSFENRIRLTLEVAEAVRAAWPQEKPLLVRISATDWLENQPNESWTIAQSVELARELKKRGVDLIDVSTGGIARGIAIKAGPGFQVQFAERIRKEAEIPTAAVGLITEIAQVEEILASGKADLVLMAREFLRDPYWLLNAARERGVAMSWPKQYLRAAPAGAIAREPFAKASRG
jgi:2,4-dienoyl-CoA reductase-like NADH-dependent reductase (Old Yellow Enzyme family)